MSRLWNPNYVYYVHVEIKNIDTSQGVRMTYELVRVDNGDPEPMTVLAYELVNNKIKLCIPYQWVTSNLVKREIHVLEMIEGEAKQNEMCGWSIDYVTGVSAWKTVECEYVEE